MRKIGKFLCGLVIMLVITGGSSTVEAAEEPTFDYTVTPIFPNNQAKDITGYFDLMVKSGEKQEVQLQVQNDSNQPKKITITPTTSGTTTNGTIDYSGQKWPHTDKLIASFADITSDAQTISLDKKEKKTVTFTIQVPDQTFDGVILGGFYAQEDLGEEKVEKNENGVQIENRFAVIVGCVLRQNQEVVEQQFQLGKIKVASYGGFFSVKVPVENQAPRILSDYLYEGKIIDKDKKEVKKIDSTSFSMAPQSIFELPIKMDYHDLPAGDYNIALTLMTGNKEKKWELSKSFTVSNKERLAVVKESVEAPKWYETINWWLVAVGVLLVIVIILVFRNRKK